MFSLFKRTNVLKKQKREKVKNNCTHVLLLTSNRRYVSSNPPKLSW